MEKIVSSFDKELSKLEKTIKEPLTSVVTFVKKHKQLLIAAAVIYFAFTYLADEE